MLTEDIVERIAQYAKEFYELQCDDLIPPLLNIRLTIKQVVHERDINGYVVKSDGFIELIGTNGRHYGMAWWMDQLLLTKYPHYTFRQRVDSGELGRNLAEKYSLDMPPPIVQDTPAKPKAGHNSKDRSSILNEVAEFVRVYMTREITSRSSLAQYCNRVPPDVKSDEANDCIDITVDSITNSASSIGQLMRNVRFINGCFVGNLAVLGAKEQLEEMGYTLKYINAKDPFFVIDVVTDACDEYLRKMAEGPLTAPNLP